ncbi:MAG: tRNA (adenosine(37)-N6)-dimethylallyltransferase MiaA [Candidatus Pacebacteria bacterium]|nr:tRNA (adenosine(37)-N6)-dimethylallyltransferase MiaA [Candidatus Paceibacterota bacterium]
MTIDQTFSSPAPSEANGQDLRAVIVLGPTATGKTRLGVDLARRFNGEIVSADSRQVYRGMDIGTGKDLNEYGSGADRVPVHLVDLIHPMQTYHLFHYLKDARTALRGIVNAGKQAFIVGGTPLYINALLENYKMEGGPPTQDLRRTLEQLGREQLLVKLQQEAPDIYERTDKTQRKRILRGLEIARTRGHNDSDLPELRLNALLIAPYYHRKTVHARIEKRLEQRLQKGLVEEVQSLHDKEGLTWERLQSFGLEYRYVARCLMGELTVEDMRAQLLAKIRRFAKSQDVWFRKMEREGKDIYWIPKGDPDKAAKYVEQFLRGDKLPPPMLRLKDRLYGPRAN